MSDNLVQMPRPTTAPTSTASSSSPAPIEGRAVVISRRFSREWLPSVAWQIRRTGQRGLIGIGLMATAAIFLMSTHWPLVNQVQTMRDDLQASLEASARHAATAEAPAANDPRRLLESLPTRNEVPKLLGVILTQADGAGLSIDTGKYDVAATRTGAVTRYNVSFPVTGPYPAVRSFIDQVLKSIPTASISELAIERKTIADGMVEANVRLTLFTRGQP